MFVLKLLKPQISQQPATSIQDLFHNTWLARYPRPQFIVLDSGSTGEFKREFKQMCMQDNYGFKAKPTTNHNHQNHENLEEQEDNSFDYFLQSTVWQLCY
jgi:hypothetical protein